METKYVDCEYAKQLLRYESRDNPYFRSQACQHAIDVLNDMPAADVKPVVRGEWIFEEYELASWCTKAVCSSCKKTVANNSDLAHDWGQRLFLHDYKFCPNCGADMRIE